MMRHIAQFRNLLVMLTLLVIHGENAIVAAQDSGDVVAPGRPPVLLRPIQDLTIPEDVPFRFNLWHTGSVFFGYDVGGIDVTIKNNYFASHVSVYQPWQKIVFTGNTLIARDGRLATLKMAPSADIDWDNNRYFSSNAKPFVYEGSQTWEQWRAATRLDESSTLAPEKTGTDVFVRPNRYEPGRGHIVVYNWERLDRIEVDLTSIVKRGVAYNIFNVLNLRGGPVLSGVFDGAIVSLPMASVPFPLPIGHKPPAPLVLDREFSTFLVLSEAEPVPETGQSFYVSTDGSPLGDGSSQNPWDLRTALRHPQSVQPGDTIWVRGGTYLGGFKSELAGTELAPIQVREVPGEEVRIDLYDDSDHTSTLITIAGQYTGYWGFEIFSTDPSPRLTSEKGSWPAEVARGNINVEGDHIKLINLEIHDLNKGLGFWSDGTGGESNGLIIYNNGWTGSDRNHGHAIYTQNEGATRRLLDNITFNQFRNGIAVYGSSDSVLKDYQIEGNVSFANGGAVGEGYNGSFQLLIGGGSPAENISVIRNFTYDLPGHFREGDVTDSLSFSAECDDGRPLPDWLTFVENEGYFYGTPTNNDVGTILIRITAYATSGDKATDAFRLTVANADDPPRLRTKRPTAGTASIRITAPDVLGASASGVFDLQEQSHVDEKAP